MFKLRHITSPPLSACRKTVLNIAFNFLAVTHRRAWKKDLTLHGKNLESTAIERLNR